MGQEIGYVYMELTVSNPSLPLEIIAKQLPGYSAHLRQFQGFLNDKNLRFGQDGIRAYIAFVRNTYRSPSTINVKTAAVKAGLKLMYKNSPEYFDLAIRTKIDDFLSSLKLIKINSVAVEKSRVLSEDAVERLLERLPRKWSLLVRFYLATALRVSEGLSVKLEDLIVKDKYYSVTVIGKGNKAREVKVQKDLVDSIRAEYGGSTYLFESKPYRNGQPGGKPLRREYVSKVISEKTWLYLGVAHSVHDLRHTALTLMLKKTNRIKAVSSWAGHSSVSTTLNLYVHDELTLEELGI